MGWRVVHREWGPFLHRASAASLERGAADHLSFIQLTDGATSGLLASDAGARNHHLQKQLAQRCQLALLSVWVQLARVSKRFA